MNDINYAEAEAESHDVSTRTSGEFTLVDINGAEDVAFDHATGRLLVHADGGEEPTHKIDLSAMEEK